MLEDVLDGLFEIAKADGVLHPGEIAFLERVAEIFGFAPNEFRRIRASHFAPELTDPYVILGLSYVAGEEEIRQTYRRLVRENHPDKRVRQCTAQSRDRRSVLSPIASWRISSVRLRML